MALNANALTTVAAVSAMVSGPTNGEIEAAINAVSQAIEDKLGRSLKLTTFTEEDPDLYQGSGRPWLLVRHYPIVSVSYCSVGGAVSTDYRIIPHKANGGQLFRLNGWPKAVQGYGDLTRDNDHAWVDFSIELGYVGGYITPGQATEEDPSTLPASLELAARLAAVATLERAADGELVREKTPGGWDREWSQSAGRALLPAQTLDLIMPYRSRL